MAVEKFGASERLACKILGQNRSAFRKKKPDMGLAEAELRAALRAVAVTHPAWGWRKARWHLRAQPAWTGVALNAKRVRRLWPLTCGQGHLWTVPRRPEFGCDHRRPIRGPRPSPGVLSFGPTPRLLILRKCQCCQSPAEGWTGR